MTEKEFTRIERNKSAIEYNKYDSSRKIKELAAFMKQKWRGIFCTFTASDKTSPFMKLIMHWDMLL